MLRTLAEINNEFFTDLQDVQAASGIEALACTEALSHTKVSSCTEDFSHADNLAVRDASPRMGAGRMAADILFYIAVIVAIYLIVSIDINEGTPRNLFGFSCFTVMSSSMQDEIPKGSLIFVRSVGDGELSAGDNITFTRAGSETTVTHKIVKVIGGVLEQSGNTHPGSSTDIESNPEPGRSDFGVRYQTKGVNNLSPDSYLVTESDVIGKVVCVLPWAGVYINAVSENIHIVLILFLLCMLLSFFLRCVFKEVCRRK